MASADSTSAYQEALTEAVLSTGLDPDEADLLEQRLIGLGFTHSGAVVHYLSGKLRVLSSRAAALVTLESSVVAAGAPAPPAATLELTQTLGELVERVLEHHDRVILARTKSPEPTESAVTATAADVGHDAYLSLAKYQGRSVALSERMNAAAVGEMAKHLSKHGTLETIPSVSNPSYASKVGSKRELGLGELADGTQTKLLLDSDSSKAARTIAAVQENIKCVMLAVLAAFSRLIRADAYGGGGDGIIAVPGEKREVRVNLCTASVDRLIWRLVQAGNNFPPDGAAQYVTLVDGVLYIFLQHCEQCTMHPSAIINYMLDNTPQIFKYVPADDASATSTHTDAMAPPGKGGRGVCTGWISNGVCNKYLAGTCPLDHPPNAQGCMHGVTSGGGSCGSPYPKWGGKGNHGGGWNGGGWNGGGFGAGQPNPNWWANWQAPMQQWVNQNSWGGKGGGGPPSGGKGGGKGGGGKGKGKGKGWGKGW
jgi:hypothetical protein